MAPKSDGAEQQRAAGIKLPFSLGERLSVAWPRFQPYVHIIGLVITGASLVFVGIYLYQLIRDQGASLLTAETLWRLAIGSLIYTGTGFVLASAWINIVNSLSREKLSFKDGLCIYAVTQVFKYLPSNVLHAVGRYGMTRARGLSHRAVLLSMGVETLLLGLAALTLALLFGLTFIQQVLPDIVARIDWRIVALAVAVVTVIVGLTAHAFIQSDISPLRLGLSYLLFVAFFLICGLIALGLVYGFTWSGFPSHTLEIIGAIAAAWLGGWVTPGASAGIGVREALIIIMLSPLIGGDTAAFMAVTYRVVTTVGNLCFALLGLLMARHFGNWSALLPSGDKPADPGTD